MVSFSRQQRQAEPQRRFCANRSPVSATGTRDRDAARLAGSGQGMGSGQGSRGPGQACQRGSRALSSLQLPPEVRRVSPSGTKAEILCFVVFWWWQRLFTAPLKKTGKSGKQTLTKAKATALSQGHWHLICPPQGCTETPGHVGSILLLETRCLPCCPQNANSIRDGGKTPHEVSKAQFRKPVPKQETVSDISFCCFC